MRLLIVFALITAPLQAFAEMPRVERDFAGQTTSPARLEIEIRRRLEAKEPTASLTFRNAKIDGNLNLSDWSVPFILRFSQCTFQGQIDFSRFASERSLIFDRCVFQRGANFSLMRVGRDLRAENCQFRGVSKSSADRDSEPTSFIHCLVSDNFSLSGSEFLGSVNLRHLSVGRDLYLQDTVYHSPESDPDGGAEDIYLVKLEGTQIGHFLRIDRILDDHPRTRIAVNDCNFAGIFAQTKKGSTEAKEEAIMLDMLEGMPYRAESYSLIEHEFVRRGRHDLADDVYIHGQDRETADASPFTFARFRGLALKFVAGYGRKPALAFAWCLIAILVGAVVFLREETEQSERKRYLSAFWYSLDLFIPVVSVNGKPPEPPEGPFAHSYVRIHRLLGWLLLPIALAAISGIVGKG